MEKINERAYREALNLLHPLQSERVLEIGYGTGRFVELLLRACNSCYIAGVDPTSTMVRVANSRRAIAANTDRLDLRCGDASALPWTNDSFDAIVAIHSFQFWSDPARALDEIRRVLKTSGRIVLILRDHAKRAPAWLPNPISRSGAEVKAAANLLVRHGFDVIEHSTKSSPALVGYLHSTLGSGAQTSAMHRRDSNS